MERLLVVWRGTIREKQKQITTFHNSRIHAKIPEDSHEFIEIQSGHTYHSANSIFSLNPLGRIGR